MNEISTPPLSAHPVHDRFMTATVSIPARRHAPILMCDAGEPFRPVWIGVTRLEPGDTSPTTPHVLTGPAGTHSVLEYAIWWDGDIGHLYELEHVWVFLDQYGERLHVAASAHGGILDMNCVSEDGRPLLYCEPGKHAHAESRDALMQRGDSLARACTREPEARGILVNDLFAEALTFLTPYDRFLAREYLRALQFTPNFNFTTRFDLAALPMMSWHELQLHIPRFLRDQMESLRAARQGVKAIFIDSGDTLIDEASQIFDRDEPDLVLSARIIAGADALIDGLRTRGYPIALVADGREQSFINVHEPLGFWDAFDGRAISEITGVCKPDPVIFHEAMSKLGLRESDAEGIIMVGNNLARDIRGANALGLVTIWLDWVDRYDKLPNGDIERPDFIAKTPADVLAIIESLEDAAKG